LVAWVALEVVLEGGVVVGDPNLGEVVSNLAWRGEVASRSLVVGAWGLQGGNLVVLLQVLAALVVSVWVVVASVAWGVNQEVLVVVVASHQVEGLVEVA